MRVRRASTLRRVMIPANPSSPQSLRRTACIGTGRRVGVRNRSLSNTVPRTHSRRRSPLPVRARLRVASSATIDEYLADRPSAALTTSCARWPSGRRADPSSQAPASMNALEDLRPWKRGAFLADRLLRDSPSRVGGRTVGRLAKDSRQKQPRKCAAFRYFDPG